MMDSNVDSIDEFEWDCDEPVEERIIDNTENIRNILNKIDEQLGCDNE